MQRDIRSNIVRSFEVVPGLINEIELLTWAHRGESPVIYASTYDQSDAGGSGVHAKLIPRSLWDGDPRFLEPYSDPLRDRLRQIFDSTSFCPTKKYVCVMTMHTLQHSEFSVNDFEFKLIRGVEITEALTTATRAEDLADAFAWTEGACPSPAAAQETH